MALDRFRYNLAVVIGINDYRNGVPSLKTPENDAQTLAEILKDKHGYEVELMLNDAADRSALQDLLKTELPKRLTRDDRLLFYFAGHGIALNGDDGPEGYLIPYGASMGEVNTYLPMAQVNQALLQLPCRHFLGILDCCFAGAFRWSSTRKLVSVELGTIHKERFDRFIQDPAWQVITSAASDQFALDVFDLKSTHRELQGDHSPFAAALIEALQGDADAFPPATNGKPAGDGVITATELYLYLRDWVEPDTDARGIRQTPGIFPLKNHDKGEYIFLSPGHPLNLPEAPPLDVSSNPYRGLESFDEAHKDLFFGRQALTKTLTEFVAAHSLTVVLGASGSGKSSLVKAGLIPKLRQGNDWYLLPPFRPGESPLKALNQALASGNLPASAAGAIDLPVAPAADTVASGLLTPAQSLAHWFEEHPQAHLLIVVDQLEELITLCRDQKERRQFLAMLAEAIASHPNQLHLVLTLRSDFEPQFRNTAVEPNWQAARFVVPAMTREELRQAIEAPASARVMYFDPQELVDQLIDEVANMPGALPLLSFALSELYLNYLKRQEDARNRGKTLDRAITQTDYEELGGVTRSLTQRAEREYDALVQEDPAYEHTVRNVMLRMVSVGGELARRRVPLFELDYPEPENGRIQTALIRFETARLLTSGTDTENRPYIEPAHDVLVRGWQRLLEWKQQNLASLVLQRELYPRAEKWKQEQSNKQSIGLLWNSDPRLPQLQQLLNSENNWLNQTEMEFVKRSSQRKTNNLRTLIGSVLAVILALSGLAAYALNEAKRANQQTDLANKNAETAQRNAETAQRNEKRANEQTDLANKNEQTAKNEAKRANQQTDLANKNAETAQRNEKRANEQTDLAKKNQQLAEYRATVAQLREQAARVLNLIPTANAVQGLILAIDTMNRSQSVPSVELTAQANLLSAVLVSQEVNRLQGHTSAVGLVAFSPDGKRILSGSSGTVRIWDAQTGQPIGQPLNGPSFVSRSVAFSQDGKRIVGIVGTRVQIWNAQTGQPCDITFEDNTTSVTSVAFSSDGKRIVGSADNTLRIWDAQTGKQIGQPLKGHTSIVNSLAFRPDGKRIVSGSDDNTVRIWDAQTGQPIGQPLQGHTDYVRSVAFSGDGKRIVSGSSDNTVRIWDAQTGTQIGQPLYGHEFSVRSVAFSGDGKRIVSGSDDNTLRIWDTLTGKQIGQPLLGHTSVVTSAAFSPDGSRRIVSGSDDGTVRIWDAQILQFGQPLQGLTDNVISVAFSGDGKRIVSGSSDNTMRILDTLTGKLIGQPLHGITSSFSPLAFSPDGKRIVGYEDKTVIVSRNSSVDLRVQIRDAQTGKQIGQQLLGHKYAVSSVAFSPDGQRIVSGSYDNTLRIWDAQTGKQIGQPLKGHTSIVNSLAFRPDGKRIVSGSDDNTLQIWDAQTGQPIGQPLQGHTDNVRSVAFSGDGKRIVSGSSDNTVRIWDAQTGTQIGQPLYGHKYAVSSVAFSPDGKRIVSGSNDNTLRIWDVQTGQPIGQPLQGHTDNVRSVAFSPDGKRIVSSSKDNTVRIWDASPESWLAIACNRLQYHPLLNEQGKVINDPEFLKVVRRARAVCQQKGD